MSLCDHTQTPMRTHSGRITIAVNRFGKCNSHINLRYYTEDINIDESYVASEGEVPSCPSQILALVRPPTHSRVQNLACSQVKFVPGQYQMQLEIPIKDNRWWNVEAFMNVKLEILEGTAQLGELHTARVVLLNDDGFPMKADPKDPCRHPCMDPRIITHTSAAAQGLALSRTFARNTWCTEIYDLFSDTCTNKHPMTKLVQGQW